MNHENKRLRSSFLGVNRKHMNPPLIKTMLPYSAKDDMTYRGNKHIAVSFRHMKQSSSKIEAHNKEGTGMSLLTDGGVNPELKRSTTKVKEEEFAGYTIQDDEGSKRNGSDSSCDDSEDGEKTNPQSMDQGWQNKAKEPLSDSDYLKCSLELKKGVPVRTLKNSNKGLNALVLNKYDGGWGKLLFLYHSLFHFEHVVLLVHIFAQAVSGHREAADYGHVIFIALASITCQMSLNYLHDSKLKQAAEKVNSKAVEKFIFTKRHKSFQLSDWGSLQTGDIFKIKTGQEIPCDALILNIAGSKHAAQTCYQRGSLWDDAKTPSLRASYQGTMNRSETYISDSKFVEQVSGLVRWEYNHHGQFSGDFKQTDNPAAFEILPENVVQRGCFVSECQFMICLCLNVGLATMGNSNRSLEQLQGRIKRGVRQGKQLNRPEGIWFRALRTLQILAFTFCLAPCILVLFEDFALRNTSMGRFANTFIHLLPTTGTDKLGIMFDVMAGFMFNLPYLAILCMEGVTYFHAYFILWDINLVPAYVSFTNLRAMKTLAQVDTIVCGKSAIADQENRYCACFKVADVLCTNEGDEGRPPAGAGRTEAADSNNESEDSEDDDREALEYLPNQAQSISGFTSAKAKELLQKTHPRHKIFKEFLTAITVCHQASSAKAAAAARAESPSGKSLIQMDDPQLRLAETLGSVFKSRTNGWVEITQGGSTRRFEELVLRRVKFGGDWMTVQVLKPEARSGKLAKMYFKGNLRILRRFLKAGTHSCLNDIDQFCREGIHSVGIAKKELELADAAELGRTIMDNSAQESREQDSDEALLRHAQRLDLLGVVGLKSATNPRDALLMEELRKNGVKVFFMSTDAGSEAITDLNALRVFQDYNLPLNVVGRTDRQVEESLKGCLKQLVERRSAEPGDGSAPGSGPAEEAEAAGRDAPPDFVDSDQRNSVFVSGKSLQFILKDDTLTKLFLTLCSLCTIVVASAVTPYQKRDLTAAARQFNIQGKLGYVVSVVSSQADKFTSLESDTTVALSRAYQQSDLLAASDVQMRDLYGLGYILFKHGTVLHRRLKVVVDEFIYRTVLLSITQLFFFVMGGFSTVLPYGALFFAAHTAVFSPISCLLEGVMHTDYGFGVFHRIYGEYKFNRASPGAFDFLGVIFASVTDALLFCLFYAAGATYWQDLQITTNGKTLAWQSSQFFNSLILSMVQFWRHRSTLCVTKTFVFLNVLAALLSVAFSAEDEHLAGLTSLSSSPNALCLIGFIALTLFLKQRARLFYTFFYSKASKNVYRYIAIEDRLYMEEYEDPAQQFDISDSAHYDTLLKQAEDSKLFSINQNLLKVHRSDSVDQILDRINVQGGPDGRRSNGKARQIINKLNLKLSDINKEIEYNQLCISGAQVKNYTSVLWTSAVLYTVLGLFKIFNQFVTDDDAEQDVAGAATNTIGTLYVEVLELLVSVGAIYFIRCAKGVRSDLVIFGLVIIFNATVNVYFYIDPHNPLIQSQFLYTIAFSHLIRLNSVFFVGLVCFASAVGFLNIRLATIQELDYGDDSSASSMQLVWQALAVTIYLFFWTYYSYWDEIRAKVRFVTQFRHIKELQKLKSMTNILVPSLVRSRAQDGKKNVPEAQGEVTVIYADIGGFDRAVQQYTGRELVELLDRIYNAFDALCEQHGLQQIETVGKTYMACGGLKALEKDIDNRLLSQHHSVRVTEFACALQAYARTQALRGTETLTVKVGIHTGEVVAGVVGEIKPQFSLVGPAVDKAARVSAQCPAGKVLVSRETHAQLQARASSFVFAASRADLRGVAREDVFAVLRQRRHAKPARREPAAKPDIKRPKAGRAGAAVPREQRPPKGPERPLDEHQSPEIEISLRGLDEGPISSGHMSSIISDKESRSPRHDDFEDNFAGNFLASELKDDRAIVQSAAQNDRYNLVERPRFLLSFEQKEQEWTFMHAQLKANQGLEVFQLVFKAVLDLVILECLLYTIVGHEKYYWYIGMFVTQVMVAAFLLQYMRRMTSRRIRVFLAFQIAGICFSLVIFILNGPRFQNLLLRSSQEVTLAIYQAIIVISRAIPFRVFVGVQALLYVGLISQNFFFIEEGELNLQTYVIDSILQLLLFALLILASHSREMKVRRQYNQQRIIKVEIKKTAELLGKLVPLHTLAGLKNDQRVVDSLENVTMIYATILDISDFSRDIRPSDYVMMLSRIFSKFDHLCDQIGIYKVHTISGCYVAMSYTGKVPAEQRSPAIQADEAFSCLQVGTEMQRILNEENAKNQSSGLGQLRIRIGIHSGKIVGGLIGTKVVRYDIFGPDVLLANKIGRNGNASAICVSEETYKLISKQVEEAGTFNFNPSGTITAVGRTVKYFQVESVEKKIRSKTNDESSLLNGSESQIKQKKIQIRKMTEDFVESEEESEDMRFRNFR